MFDGISEKNRIRMLVALGVAFCFLNIVALMLQIRLITAEVIELYLPASEVVRYSIFMVLLMLSLYTLTTGKRTAWIITSSIGLYVLTRDMTMYIVDIISFTDEYYDIPAWDVILVTLRLVLLIAVTTLVVSKPFRRYCLSLPEGSAADRENIILGIAVAVTGFAVFIASLFLSWMYSPFTDTHYDGLSFLQIFGTDALYASHIVMYIALFFIGTPMVLATVHLFTGRIRIGTLSALCIVFGINGVLSLYYWFVLNGGAIDDIELAVFNSGYYIAMFAASLVIIAGMLLTISQKSVPASVEQ